jgi:hypothetical protein
MHSEATTAVGIQRCQAPTLGLGLKTTNVYRPPMSQDPRTAAAYDESRRCSCEGSEPLPSGMAASIHMYIYMYSSSTPHLTHWLYFPCHNTLHTQAGSGGTGGMLSRRHKHTLPNTVSRNGTASCMWHTQRTMQSHTCRNVAMAPVSAQGCSTAQFATHTSTHSQPPLTTHVHDSRAYRLQATSLPQNKCTVTCCHATRSASLLHADMRLQMNPTQTAHSVHPTVLQTSQTTPLAVTNSHTWNHCCGHVLTHSVQTRLLKCRSHVLPHTALTITVLRVYCCPVRLYRNIRAVALPPCSPTNQPHRLSLTKHTRQKVMHHKHSCSSLGVCCCTTVAGHSCCCRPPASHNVCSTHCLQHTLVAK